MKKSALSIALLSVLLACGPNKQDDKLGTDAVANSASAEGKTNIDLPEIKFEEEEFDFGMITQGEKVSHAFLFKNTGSKPLVISGASGSCGCTVPEWPKEPVAPGAEGRINVVFSSEGKKGLVEKTVTVITNCEPSTKILRIKTEIVVAEAAQ